MCVYVRVFAGSFAMKCLAPTANKLLGFIGQIRHRFGLEHRTSGAAAVAAKLIAARWVVFMFHPRVAENILG